MVLYLIKSTSRRLKLPCYVCLSQISDLVCETAALWLLAGRLLLRVKCSVGCTDLVALRAVKRDLFTVHEELLTLVIWIEVVLWDHQHFVLKAWRDVKRLELSKECHSAVI